ncbi:hypothetical protein SAMN05443667_101264 [Flavobacterium gillisiae]|uniref:Uncharacterized protein n=1 Tax=Flavobacterium gillisiae TaxID=150146 RepID=A0A1H3WVP9_9FLAO|nr:hypothetical protein [Flavobacterium gillisiae]SDZ91235.1 hypothetical protein SAMN05443667_101264 [Flavobacterium gillisiae]
MRNIHNSVQKARKRHHDDGYEKFLKDWIEGGFYLPKGQKVSFAHYRQIATYLKKENPYIIEKGEEYIRQFNTDGSDSWTFSMNKKMYDIANYYYLFDIN